MLFLSNRQQWVFLLLQVIGHASVVQTSGAACPSCLTWGTLLHYNDTVTKKCVETCVLLGYFYQSATLKCGKCPATSPPPPPPPPPPPAADTNFSITLDLEASVAAAYRPDILRAKAKWEKMIIGDLVNFNLTQADVAGTTCSVRVGQIVDDVFVCVKTATVDNVVGGVVAQYKVDRIRADGPNKDLPIISQITIDVLDVASLAGDSLYGWMLKFMTNALGFGILWPNKGLAAPTAPCSYQYGSSASREFRTVSGCNLAVPLVQTGTQEICRAWSEACLQSEMMTLATLSGSVATKPISRITLGSMEDLGYKVNYTSADAYTIQNPKTVCCPGTRRQLKAEEMVNHANAGVATAQLSEEGRAKAIAYGKQVLAEAGVQRQNSASALKDNDVGYVGDQAIGLLYKENGDYFTLTVRNTD